MEHMGLDNMTLDSARTEIQCGETVVNTTVLKLSSSHFIFMVIPFIFYFKIVDLTMAA